MLCKLMIIVVTVVHMSEKKVDVACQVRLNAYGIISDAIDRGLRLGWYRAHKHADSPDQETIFYNVHNEIMNELCDVLKFDDE